MWSQSSLWSLLFRNHMSVLLCLCDLPSAAAITRWLLMQRFEQMSVKIATIQSLLTFDAFDAHRQPHCSRPRTLGNRLCLGVRTSHRGSPNSFQTSHSLCSTRSTRISLLRLWCYWDLTRLECRALSWLPCSAGGTSTCDSTALYLSCSPFHRCCTCTLHSPVGFAAARDAASPCAGRVRAKTCSPK